MNSDKEQILRNLEYINGGITAFKQLCLDSKNHQGTIDMIEDWQDTICNTIDMIEEVYNKDA